MKTPTAFARLAALEAGLESALTGHARALETIAATITKAETLLASFDALPTENIGLALEADTTIASADRLRAALGTPASYASRMQDKWITENHAELIQLLADDLETRCGGRLQYRRSQAERIGALSAQCALADGTDVEAEAELFEIERDLARRDEQRDVATAALRDLKANIAAALQSRILLATPFEAYQIARAAVLGVDFSIPTNSTKPISEVPFLEKTQA